MLRMETCMKGETFHFMRENPDLRIQGVSAE
jgi:hypothetical protein